jgi:hypothetical protein
MVMSMDLEDDTTPPALLTPEKPGGGGAITVTVLGGATSVTVRVLQWVLDEAAGGVTKIEVTEVTSSTDVTRDATSEEYAVPAKATLARAVTARRFLKIAIGTVVTCWKRVRLRRSKVLIELLRKSKQSRELFQTSVEAMG